MIPFWLFAWNLIGLILDRCSWTNCNNVLYNKLLSYRLYYYRFSNKHWYTTLFFISNIYYWPKHRCSYFLNFLRNRQKCSPSVVLYKELGLNTLIQCALKKMILQVNRRGVGSQKITLFSKRTICFNLKFIHKPALCHL